MANYIKTIFSKSSKLNINQLILRKTVVSFFFFFVLAGAAFLGWKWLRYQTSSASGTRPLLRSVLNANESIFSLILSDKHLAKTYPESAAAANVRVNGYEGLKTKLDSAAWRLTVIRKNGDTLSLTMDEIKKLPKTDIVFNFKCIF